MRVTPYTTDAGGGRRAALSSGSAERSGETGRGVLQRATPDPWGKPTAYGCDDSDGVVAGPLQFILRLKRLSARWSGGEKDTTLGTRNGGGRAALLVRIDSIPDEDGLSKQPGAAGCWLPAQTWPRCQDAWGPRDLHARPSFGAA